MIVDSQFFNPELVSLLWFVWGKNDFQAINHSYDFSIETFSIQKPPLITMLNEFEMRQVKDSISDRKIFYDACLDQVTASEPLSQKVPRNFWIYKQP